MSPAGSSRGRKVYVEGPSDDVFTMILVVSLICIFLACIFLFLSWWGYDFGGPAYRASAGTGSAGGGALSAVLVGLAKTLFSAVTG